MEGQCNVEADGWARGRAGGRAGVQQSKNMVSKVYRLPSCPEGVGGWGSPGDACSVAAPALPPRGAVHTLANRVVILLACRHEKAARNPSGDSLARLVARAALMPRLPKPSGMPARLACVHCLHSLACLPLAALG